MQMVIFSVRSKCFNAIADCRVLADYSNRLSVKLNKICPSFAKFEGGYPQSEKERCIRWGGNPLISGGHTIAFGHHMNSYLHCSSESQPNTSQQTQ